jgi:hypothetical protein
MLLLDRDEEKEREDTVNKQAILDEKVSNQRQFIRCRREKNTQPRPSPTSRSLPLIYSSVMLLHLIGLNSSTAASKLLQR